MFITSNPRSVRAVLLAGAGAVCLGLGGCASVVQGLAKSQNSGILNPDPVSGERDSDGEFVTNLFGLNHDEELNQGRLLRGCKRIGPDAQCVSPKGEKAPPPPLLLAPTGPASLPYNYLQAMQASRAAPENSDNARVLISSAIALSNNNCADWFTRLNVAQTTLDQTSSLISSTGTLTTVFLGVGRAATRAITGTAGLFGFGKQAVDDLNHNYIVAVDLGSVRSALIEYRGRYATEIQSNEGPWNFFTAMDVIKAYDGTCTALSVKRFINKRVENDKPATNDDKLYDTAVEAALAKLDTPSGLKIAPKDLTAAYVVAIEKGVRSDVLAEAFASLPQPVRDGLADPAKVEALKKVLRDSGLTGHVELEAQALVATTTLNLEKGGQQATQAVAANAALADKVKANLKIAAPGFKDWDSLALSWDNVVSLYLVTTSGDPAVVADARAKLPTLLFTDHDRTKALAVETADVANAIRFAVAEDAVKKDADVRVKALKTPAPATQTASGAAAGVKASKTAQTTKVKTDAKPNDSNTDKAGGKKAGPPDSGSSPIRGLMLPVPLTTGNRALNIPPPIIAS
jgi:hypothetical protein